MAMRCVGKVADAHKCGRKFQRRSFRSLAKPYDAHIFRFVNDAKVSLWSLVVGKRSLSSPGRTSAGFSHPAKVGST